MPTDEQFDLSELVANFIAGALKEDRKYSAIEGVPGAGKTFSMEVALENLIRHSTKFTGISGRKTIIYVAPKASDLLNKMKAHIKSIPGGQTFLDTGLIMLCDYQAVITRFSMIPAKAHQNIMCLFDEAHHLEQAHARIIFQSGAFLAFGDMNQASSGSEQHFFDLIDNAKPATQILNTQTLTESFRCPAEIMDFGNLFLSERNKAAKRLGIKQRTNAVADTSGVSTFGKHVKFYAKGFVDSIKAHSTDVAFVTFSPERKASLVKQGKINVFLLSEITGLEFPKLVKVMDCRELACWLGDGKCSGSFNDVYMGSTRAQDILYVDQELLTATESCICKYCCCFERKILLCKRFSRA